MDFIPTSSSKTSYNSATTSTSYFEDQVGYFVSNEEVLKRTDVEDIELKLVGNRLRCLGHICRMDDNKGE